MTKEEYHFFLHNRLKQHCILGNDYYRTNEHRVFENGHTTASGEVFGYTEITRQYYNRYRLPIMECDGPTKIFQSKHLRGRRAELSPDPLELRVFPAAPEGRIEISTTHAHR